jgi:hypothetical protein
LKDVKLRISKFEKEDLDLNAKWFSDEYRKGIAIAIPFLFDKYCYSQKIGYF